MVNGMADIAEEKKSMIMNNRQRFYDIVFLIGFLCCLVPGTFPKLTTAASILMILCIIISIRNKNFYLYLGLFMYMRYRMLIGETPAYRIYSYLVVMKLLTEFFRLRFRLPYLPAIFVIIIHSLFALPPIASQFFELPLSHGFRVGANIIVDIFLVYMIIYKLAEEKLMRRFFAVFLLGGIASGVYGWFNPDVSVDINIAGAGVHTVNRNFGALSDSNFAGMYYSLCVVISILIKGIPKYIKGILVVLFFVLILQTASLSALLILFLLTCFTIVLKYRTKSILILSATMIGLVIVFSIILIVPQFREIKMIAGLLIRIEEKFSYFLRGRWDLLTTDRAALWGQALDVFRGKSFIGKLIGGSVVTVMATDYSIIPGAVHNTYLQGLLNFGILGTLLIYLPLFGTFGYRLLSHFKQKSGYEDEDVKMIRMLFVFTFVVFGMTVDFFADWPLMLFYFI